MMGKKNQATSSAVFRQSTQVQGEAAPAPLRRSIRLQNRGSKSISLQKEIGYLATTGNHSSIRCKKKKNQRRKGNLSLSMLPNDILVDIMSRLPPKVFFRCKCITKSFETLSRDAFHLNRRFRPTVSGLFHDTITIHGCLHFKFAEVSAEGSQDIDTCLRVLPHHDNMKIIDCCNGLLLLQAWNVFMQKSLYVYNPALHKILAVWSVPPRKNSWSFYEVFSLAFDWEHPSLFYIVCFRGWRNDGGVDTNCFQTFSSKTCKWRAQKKLDSDCRINIWNNSTFVGSKVYRLAAENKVVSVDPSKNSFEVIELPDIENSSRPQIGKSQGYLHFIVMANEMLEIWILDSQQHWILKHQLVFSQIFGVPGYEQLGFVFFNLNLENPVALHPEEDVLFIPSASGNLLAFDLKTHGRRELRNLHRKSMLVFWVYTACYLA